MGTEWKKGPYPRFPSSEAVTMTSFLGLSRENKNAFTERLLFQALF